MRLTDEMVELDDRKYRDRNVLVELKYMGREIKHRKAVTNDDLRFMAWLYRSALNLLKEQENWLGTHQTADGITFIASGTAKQGEKRGIMLGEILMYERLEKELMHRGLLTDDIRSAFAKVWGEPE